MAYDGASTVDLSKVLRKPGRLVVGPTDLSAAFPYGSGTYLGRTTSGLSLMWPPVVTPLVSPDEQGLEPFDVLFIGHGPAEFVVELSQWDDNVLQAAWAGQTVAGSTQRKVQSPSAQVPALLSSGAVTLLFVPRDATAAPSILIRSAVVMAASEEIRFRLLRETGMVIRIIPLRATSVPSNEERFVMGLLSDLSLT